MSCEAGGASTKNIDIRSRLRALADASAQTSEDVQDVGGGKLVTSVTDGNGNVMLMQVAS